MVEFQLHSQLYETIESIRSEVRGVFEDLRLKNVDGDISGKDRLERVPSLARRNFRNLVGPDPRRAVREAWRLVDFLEGAEQARLTPLAREGLRGAELDRIFARLRGSDRWKDAAAGLREALGAEPGGMEPLASPDSDAGPTAAVPSPAPGLREPAPAAPAKRPLRTFGFRLALPIAGAASIALAFLVARSWAENPAGSPFACLALEDASGEALVRHRVTPVAPPLPRPPRTEAAQRIVTISDTPDGGPVRSIWTTSQYSFAERSGPNRPGGGKSDLRLRVGGWGDTYLSLLRVPVPSDRLAHRAVLRLTVLGDEVGSRPTPLNLRAVTDDWRVRPGSDNRLWWKDCPWSEAVANHLPPPGPRGSIYEIDITDLYNMWAAGLRPAYGIILEPEQIGSWGPGRPHYSNFSTFYSTRARDPGNRPRLVLTY